MIYRHFFNSLILEIRDLVRIPLFKENIWEELKDRIIMMSHSCKLDSLNVSRRTHTYIAQ
jgi:hypothetical protein